jgi:hypothetical protein
MSQLTLAAAVVVAVPVVAVPEADGATDGIALAEALAAAPFAVSPRSVLAECPLTAITTPITRPKTTGIATETAMREE